MKAIIKQYTIWESEEHLAYKSKQLKIKIRHAKHIFTALIHIFYISSNLINIFNFFFPCTAFYGGLIIYRIIIRSYYTSIFVKVHGMLSWKEWPF